MGAMLIGLDGLHQSRQFPLAAPHCTMGRSTENTIVLANPLVSRRHAEIVAATNYYQLRDCASRNGTRVNGSYIVSHLLRPGDEIIIGDERFRFEHHQNQEQQRVRPLPLGTVTFLMTDVEGSTRLWEHHPDTMRTALLRHDVLIEALVARHGGVVVRPRGEGDSRFAVFAHATGAVTAAAAIQIAFQRECWPASTQLRVRMGLHTGEADLREGDYYGSAVNRCARIRGVAIGGQTLISQATALLVRDALRDQVWLHDLGDHQLRDLSLPERIFEIKSATCRVSSNERRA
jgi:class 3 adenylate cyclase